MDYYERKKESGFTIVELLIAMTIGLIILTALSSTFLMQRKAYDVQEQIVEMVQTARAAMDMMSREIRMAGCGDPDLSWIDWVTINTNPEIVQGSSAVDPDIISIAGCFDSPRASLSANVVSGTPSLILQNITEAGKFNVNEKKFISINGLENAIIISISGDTLTIDTNTATAGNQGLSGDYGVDTPIYLVKVITYSIVEENNTLILKRNENTGAGNQPLAENIENLQISQSGKSINVSLTARTSKPDPDYTDPTYGDHYRKYILTSVITPRNLNL